MYFVYDPNGDGFIIFDTEDEAREYADEVLDIERDNAIGDEWSSDVEGLCWGKIAEQLVSFNVEPDEDDEDIADVYIDYRFEKV